MRCTEKNWQNLWKNGSNWSLRWNLKGIFCLWLLWQGFPLHTQSPELLLPQGFSREEAQIHFTLQKAFRTRKPSDTSLAQIDILRWKNIEGTDIAWSWWQDHHGKIWLVFPGSAPTSESWLMNLYAGMIPAKGQMTAYENTFSYQLSTHPEARTHAGWTAGLFQFLFSEASFMDSLYQQGNHHWVISGHSQGGALAYLTVAYLSQIQSKGSFFPNLQWKVYTSGAPKPGNLWFCRDFMARTPSHKVFSMVINSDWVPLMPAGIQQVSNFPTHSPVRQWKKLVQQMPKWKQRLALRYVVKRMTRPLDKSSARYFHWLAKTPKKSLTKKWTHWALPEPVEDFDYHPFGTQVILMPNERFLADFPQTDGNWFAHHSLHAYEWFFHPTPVSTLALTTLSLDGVWRLVQTPEWNRTLLKDQTILLQIDWAKQQMVFQDDCGLGFLPFRPEGSGFTTTQPFELTTGSPCPNQIFTQVMSHVQGTIAVHQPDQTSMEWLISGAEPWIWWRVQSEK